MRNAIRFVIALLLAICVVKTIAGQIITNPIPAAITKRGIQVEIKIEEVQLYVRDASGNRIGVSMPELVERTMGTSLPRVDLHISRSRDGELLLTSRQDGMVRMLVPESTTTATVPSRR
jgi:hypothetical protein